MGNVENLWAISVVMALAGGRSIQTETQPTHAAKAGVGEAQLELNIVSEKIMRLPSLIVAIGLLASPALATEYLSPDGAISAKVIEQSGVNCEAEIVVREQGREILRQSYISDDHQQGACVSMAAWTPNSQFFIYSLVNSGGHQPWHTPIEFFSRISRRITDLEHYVPDPVTDPKFVVSPPDVIEFVTTALPIGSAKLVHRSVTLSALKDIGR